MRTLIGTLLLAATYCLALASADPWDVGIGLVLGFLILRGFRSFIFPEQGPAGSNLLRSLVHLPRLIVAVFVDIVRGTVDVAQAVLSLNSDWSAQRGRRRFLRVPEYAFPGQCLHRHRHRC